MEPRRLLSAISVGAHPYLRPDFIGTETPMRQRLTTNNFSAIIIFMETNTITREQKIYPLMTAEERLKLLRQIRGMWKDRKPDPIEELKEIRKGWNRKIT